MKKINVKSLIIDYTNQGDTIIFNKSFFERNDYKKKFNIKIRENIKDKVGIYLFRKNKDEIIYIGKGGSILNNGEKSQHTLVNRLIASREIIKGKEILTNTYIYNLFQNQDILSISIEIYYTKEDVIPAFIESLLLNQFYKLNNCLPLLNKMI